MTEIDVCPPQRFVCGFKEVKSWTSKQLGRDGIEYELNQLLEHNFQVEDNPWSALTGVADIKNHYLTLASFLLRSTVSH